MRREDEPEYASIVHELQNWLSQIKYLKLSKQKKTNAMVQWWMCHSMSMINSAAVLRKIKFYQYSIYTVQTCWITLCQTQSTILSRLWTRCLIADSHKCHNVYSRALCIFSKPLKKSIPIFNMGDKQFKIGTRPLYINSLKGCSTLNANINNLYSRIQAQNLLSLFLDYGCLGVPVLKNVS